MHIHFWFVLLYLCLAVVNAHPLARAAAVPHQRNAAGPVSAPGPAVAQCPQPVRTSAWKQHPLPDSLRAFVGVRELHFRYVSDDSLRAALHAFYAVDTVSEKYVVMLDASTPARVLYRPRTGAAEWLEFRLERVGNPVLTGNEYTLDTVRLNQRPAVLLRVVGRESYWGSGVNYEMTYLIDVAEKPLLLLKSMTLVRHVSYGRESDEKFNDDNFRDEIREQTVGTKRGLVVVSRPLSRNKTGKWTPGTVRRMQQIPDYMLPGGRYRYQTGGLVRVGN